MISPLNISAQATESLQKPSKPSQHLMHEGNTDHGLRRVVA
jgi:hypothetical protein